MRKSRGSRNLKRMICRHGEDVLILRSNGGEYDKKTMRWTSKGRKEIKAIVALSKKIGSGSSRSATKHEMDGKRVEYDVKFYTNFPIKHDDNNNEQSDIIVWDDIQYIVVFMDKRKGGECGDSYIGYLKTYKGERIEK